ncbi:MAG TPA: bifunctional serine/threonine-protein kinase/formylglycine-generating enzyme family protein [Candidatus Hydrogenedentes bacterium]|nr:bifunctional serine/threonine-protein kinase/formylglycine-generating enzyme family protein [Candidatus Hydrogenedentota bacterium]
MGNATSEEATRLATPPADDMQFRRGQVVNGRYTVLDMIGRGGMGCIYKVHDNVLGEDVALKTLLPQFLRDKMVVERFFNEARIARKLAHPNIVRVHDIGSAGKGVFISMEYVQGESLRNMIEKLPPGKRLPVAEVLRIIDQLCVALEYAHQYTIHRDIKPENIMIDRDRRVKLMDFGISKLMDNPRMTGTAVVMGTPYYMSPEQLRTSHDVDARADIYSVGVVLYEVLTGNMPTGVPRPASQMLGEIPPAMDDIVAKCVDPNPERRFQNAAELRAALQPVIELVSRGKDITKVSRRQARGGAAFPWKKAAGWALAVLIAGGILTGLAGLARQWGAAGAPVAAPQPAAGGRTGEVLRLIGEVRARVEPLAGASEANRALFTEAERRRGLLEAAGSGAAASDAEEVLRCYLALALSRADMVFVPGGAVTVGGVSVAVPGFLMDTTEVTMGRYAKFAAEIPGGWRVPAEVRDMMQTYPDYPMTWVSLFDAQACAAHLGKTLPTRAQWALAAHGGKDTSDMYPWGGDWQAGGCNCQTQKLAPVATFERDRSWCGVSDLAGNVSEWTLTPADPAAAGRLPDFGDLMLVCGGNFADAPAPLRADRPAAYETRAAAVGFRCVLEIGVTAADVAEVLRRLG